MGQSVFMRQLSSRPLLYHPYFTFLLSAILTKCSVQGVACSPALDSGSY